jgi:uncharacterized Zn finger protein
MIGRSYFCVSCGYKSSNSNSLIKGKGGCSSCGKSNYKCPRCGMIMKMKKIEIQNNNVFEKAISPNIGIKEGYYGNIRIKRA